MPDFDGVKVSAGEPASNYIFIRLSKKKLLFIDNKNYKILFINFIKYILIKQIIQDFFNLIFIRRFLILYDFKTNHGMENSKFLQLLRAFDPPMVRAFHEFVVSPYFNKDQELVRLYDYLKPQLLKALPKAKEKTARPGRLRESVPRKTLR